VFLLAAMLVASTAVADDVFVPVVAQRQGPDGQWWNTEVWISNTSSSAGGFAAVFLPAGGASNLDRLDAEPAMEAVAPRATVFRDDLVPQGQAGALRLVVTPGVMVYARLVSAAGKASSAQGMPALSRSAAIRPGEQAFLIGLRRTPQYRTTVNLLNPVREAGTVTVRLFSQLGEPVFETTYQLPPGAVLQVDEILQSFGVVRGEHMRAELIGTIPFFALASVVDARSGAPMLVLAQR
jgi:hypothetical protein